jgi:tetratricopeptide (TPR) repeat protein
MPFGLRTRWPVPGSFAALVLLLFLTSDAAFCDTPPFRTAARQAMAGDYEAALRSYEEFARTYPNDRLAPLAELAAGTLLRDVRGDGAAAREAFDRVISNYPGSPWAPEAARRKAESLLVAEDWPGAAQAYETALDLAGRAGAQPVDWIAEAAAGAAECYYHTGDRERVLEAYGKVLAGRVSPSVTAVALCRTAEVYEETGKSAEAAAAYRKILDECPCASDESRAIAVEKRDLIDRESPIDWAPVLAYQEATGKLRTRDYAGALEICRAHAATPMSAGLRECFDFLDIQLEAAVSSDFTRGRTRLGEYQGRYPQPQLQGIEDVLGIWSDIVEAEEDVAKNPEDAGSLSTLGTLYLYGGAYPRSLETLERAAAIDSSAMGLRFILAWAYLANGRTEVAMDTFEAYLEDYPTDHLIHRRVADMAVRASQYDRAIQHLEAAVQTIPDNAPVHAALGSALSKAGRAEDAARAFEKAVEIDPALSDAYFGLAEAYAAQGRTDRAAATYEKLMAQAPDEEAATRAREALEALRGQQPPGGSPP